MTFRSCRPKQKKTIRDTTARATRGASSAGLILYGVTLLVPNISQAGRRGVININSTMLSSCCHHHDSSAYGPLTCCKRYQRFAMSSASVLRSSQIEGAISWLDTCSPWTYHQPTYFGKPCNFNFTCFSLHLFSRLFSDTTDSDSFRRLFRAVTTTTVPATFATTQALACAHRDGGNVPRLNRQRNGIRDVQRRTLKTALQRLAATKYCKTNKRKNTTEKQKEKLEKNKLRTDTRP